MESHFTSHGRGSQNLADGLRHGGRIPHGNQKSGDIVYHNFRNSAAIGGHHWLSRGHAFHDHLAKRLARRRGMHHNIESSNQFPDVRAETGEFDELIKREVRTKLFYLRLIFTSAKKSRSDNFEPRIWKTLRNGGGGLEEYMLAFPRTNSSDQANHLVSCSGVQSHGRRNDRSVMKDDVGIRQFDARRDRGLRPPLRKMQGIEHRLRIGNHIGRHEFRQESECQDRRSGQIVRLNAVADVPYNRTPGQPTGQPTNDVRFQGIRMNEMNIVFRDESRESQAANYDGSKISQLQHRSPSETILFCFSNALRQSKDVHLADIPQSVSERAFRAQHHDRSDVPTIYVTNQIE